MKKSKKYIKILVFIVVISALIAAFSLPHAEEYSVPTLYINNRAWHMYSLFPLTEQNGAYLVPSSFFGAVDGVEITLDEDRRCLLIQYGEKYISISINTSNALLHTGLVTETTVSLITDEYFIDSALCARALGFSIEVTELFEKTVLRLKTEENLLDFNTLVERNRVPEGALSQKSESADGTLSRQDKNLAFIADYTKMSDEEQAAFADFLAETNTCATIILQKDNLTDTDLLKNVVRANALGCSFVISAKNTKEVSECNDLLGKLLKNRTRLVLASDALKVPLDSIGYIPMGAATAQVSLSPTDFEFTAFTTIEITSFTNQTKANTKRWIAAAEANEVCVRALCPRTGN